MKTDKLKPFIEWFGYSRRERRASFILLILIIVIALARYVIPVHRTSIQTIQMNEVKSDSDVRDDIIQFKDRTNNNVTGRVRTSPARRELVELNRCDSASLEALPGIGPVLALRIIRYRNLLGGYFSTEQLREVYGLQEETFKIISGRVTADSSLVRRIKINSADYKQIIRLPYFAKNEVSAILRYRKENGKIKDMSLMVANKLIAPEKAWKIRHYVEFD